MMELFYKHGISVTPETKSTWLCMDDSIFAYTNAAFEDGPQINTSQTTVYNGHKELVSLYFLMLNMLCKLCYKLYDSVKGQL